MSEKIQDVLPEFVESVVSSLRSQGHAELADQLVNLEISRWSYDDEVNAMYLYLTGQRPLNIVEQNIIGVNYHESIAIEDICGDVVVDTDNFGRLTGIEILGRKDLVKRLEDI